MLALRRQHIASATSQFIILVSALTGTVSFALQKAVVWAAALIYTAYMSRQVPFVLNAAFALRGLTSGALVGGLALAVFWKKGRGTPVIAGMIVSLATMTTIQLLPKLDCTKALWMKTVGTEIFWPWYTLIGATITLLTAWLMRKLLPLASNPSSSDTPTPSSAPSVTD